jgi:hypothetical protein
MDIGNVTWRKASYSGGNGGACIEVGVWRKASYSGGNGGGCIEVASTPAALVAVRDSKDPDGPKLALSPDGWRAFTRRIKVHTAVKDSHGG